MRHVIIFHETISFSPMVVNMYMTLNISVKCGCSIKIYHFIFAVVKKPIIETCRSSLVFKGDEIVRSPTKGSTSCAYQQDVFINKVPQKANVSYEGTFHVNVTSTNPEFIVAGSWNYGLSGGRFLIIHKQFAGNSTFFTCLW